MISPIFMIRAYLTLSLCLFSALISAKPVPVIFDTDIGSDIDDVFALSLILKSPELDLKLITTVSGDTHYRAKVAAKFLQISKRTDIPVAPGRHAQASAEFLRPWINDFSTTTYPGDIKQDGIAEIISLLKAADNPRHHYCGRAHDEYRRSLTARARTGNKNATCWHARQHLQRL